MRPVAGPPAQRPDRVSILVRWAPAVLWAALIFALSSFSSLPAPPGGLTDKHAHFITYAALAALIVWGLTDRSPARTTWTVAAVAAVLTALYGVSDEWHQSFVPGRDVSALDLAADAAGGVLATVALRAWAIIRARR
ncbi:MAG: VanZ family protein [Vicinamibacteraceae bacterium]